MQNEITYFNRGRPVLRVLTLAIILTGTSGCSNQSIYDGQRISQRNGCLLEPVHLQQECIDKTRMSYEEYEHRRQEVIGD